MSEIAKIVGDRIRSFRNSRGLSQEQLAFAADLNTSYVGEVERGEKSPSIDTLYKLANALGITLEELFSFNNDDKAKLPDSIVDKVAFYIGNRTEKEQQAVFDIIKRVLSFKDDKI